MEKIWHKLVWVIVSTDVLARGIDLNIELVINYDSPNNINEYLHWIGWTGRFGVNGVSIVFKDKEYLK